MFVAIGRQISSAARQAKAQRRASADTETLSAARHRLQRGAANRDRAAAAI